MPDVKAPNLRVPTRHIDSLALLLHATETQFDAFERSLGQVKAPRSIRSLVSEAAGHAGWPEPQHANDFAMLLVSLSAQADSLPDLTIEEFAASVAQAAVATGNEKLRVSRAQWDTLGNRLGRLLGRQSSVWIWAKAAVVLNEQERLFCDTKIFTDIRPIFDRRPAVAAAFSVFHTLKLMYHHGSEDLEEVFVALDSDDLQTLKRAILRAEEKQATLESLIGRTGVPLLSPKN